MKKRSFTKTFFSYLFIVLILVAVFTKRDKLLDFLPDSIASSHKIITAKNYMVVDMKTGKKVIAKGEKERIKPASLTKLFSLMVANKVIGPDEIVIARKEAMDMVKPGSSMANIVPGKYYAKNIYHGIIAPSGNDTMYVLADHLGGKINKDMTKATDRVREYRKFLMEHLENNGIKNTKLVDVTGYSDDNYTNLDDVSKVVKNLLKLDWFRELSATSMVTTKTPSGKTLSLLNTNKFLDKQSSYYNPKITGVKTGSLDNYYNMVCLYENNKSTYLILIAGSASDHFRYLDSLKMVELIEKL